MEIKTIDPGRTRSLIRFENDISYSHACGVDLQLSFMRKMGRMQTVNGRNTEIVKDRFPLVVWFNGSAWRGVDKNQMLPELTFLVDAGFAVACVYYRSRYEAKFPAQVIDCKTAVRFLRANQERFHIDPDRIAVMGRSAGGYLASFLAMNTGEFNGTEYQGCSSNVQACVDLFGPVDLRALLEDERKRFSGRSLVDSAAGSILGGEEATLLERAYKASVTTYVNPGMCPVFIAHGTEDPLVDCSQSVSFANQAASAIGEDKVEAYLLKGARHGDEPFYQDSFKSLIVSFLKRHIG